jgi:hypothetical protein
MNDLYEQEIYCKILKILSDDPHLSSGSFPEGWTSAWGKTNYVLSEMAEKGVITIRCLANAPQRIPCMHMLSPRGLQHKTKITARFLKRKLSGYETIRAQIKEIASNFQADRIADSLEPDILDGLASVYQYQR